MQGIPESLNDDDLLPVTKPNLLIVDDLMQQASANSELQRVFSQYVHHRNLSAIYIVQNLFVQGKSSRTISLNANYMILFKNPRDVNQVAMLGRQMYPGNTKYFMECYHDAVNQPFGYIMIDYKAKLPSSTVSEQDCFPTVKWFISRKKEEEHDQITMSARLCKHLPVLNCYIKHLLNNGVLFYNRRPTNSFYRCVKWRLTSSTGLFRSIRNSTEN